MYVYYVTPGVLAPLPKNIHDKFGKHFRMGRDLFRGHHAAGSSYTHICKTKTNEVYGEIDYHLCEGKVSMLKAWIKFDNDPITKHEVFIADRFGVIVVGTQVSNIMVGMFQAAMLQTARSLQAPSYMGQLSHVVEPEDNYSLEEFMAEEAETKPTSYDAEQDMDEFMAGITFDVYPEQMHTPLDIDWGSFPMPFF